MKSLSCVLKVVFISILFLSISGCTGLGGDYSCTKVGGVSGCASMADIRGNMDDYVEFAENGFVNTSSKTLKDSVFFDLPRRDRQGKPSRSETDVIKVTVFPFIDSLGNYVDTTDIYFILEDDDWIGRLPRDIFKD